MADVGVRVALLARAGESRNQLRAALQDLGAELVCEGDPAELAPSAVSSLNPRVMVVSLEPATEASLDKFDDLLSSSDIEVVYDDAEASAQLTGWDLNRWARHLAAKIIGTDLMPPVPEGSAMAAHDEWQPKPGAPQTPAQAMADAKLEDYLQETQSLATDVPVNESYSDALQREVPEVQAPSEPEESLDFNLDDLEQAMSLNAGDGHDAPLPEAKVEIEKRTADVDEMALAEFDSFISDAATAVAASDDFITPQAAVEEFELPEAVAAGSIVGTQDEDFIDFDNAQAGISDEISLGDDASFDIDLSALENSEIENKAAESTSLELEDSASTLADFEMSDTPVAFSKYQADDAVEMSSDMDADVAALAAQLDEFEKNDNRAVAKNMDFGMLDDKPKPKEAALELASEKPAAKAEQASAPATKEPRTFDLSGLSLVDLDAEIPVAKAEPAKPVAAPAFKKSSLSLEAIDGEEPAEKPLSNVGAVLILAGMGGPDAVRQLLKALPTSLNVPVLLYQHLEVGKHDRLVAQLEKVSNMPVYLAVQGQSAEPGQVAVIPVGIGLDLVGDELFFGGAESQQALVESLPAKHSVVIVLSGAANETAAAAARVQSQGGLALAQDPKNCFEPAAAEALVNQGGKTAEIPALAKLVLDYFKN